jgi:hypothetical protein
MVVAQTFVPASLATQVCRSAPLHRFDPTAQGVVRHWGGMVLQ